MFTYITIGYVGNMFTNYTITQHICHCDDLEINLE